MTDGNGKRADWPGWAKVVITTLMFALGALAGVAAERGQYIEKVENLERRMTPVESAVVELKNLNIQLKERQDFVLKELDRQRAQLEARR